MTAPISFAQESLWFLHALGDGGAYNEMEGIRIRGPLDVAALRECLQWLARRHDMLRTVFLVENGVVLQFAGENSALRLPVLDLRALDDRARHAETLAAADAVAPFDLTHGPLLRARLLRLESDEHVLLLTIHHLCGDGWSLGILSRELEALYSALAAGRTPSLAPLRAQYRDYAAWQRETMQGERLREGVAWWKERLTGMPPLLDLPLDRARPATRAFHGGVVPMSVGSELSDRVKKLGRAQRATPFMCALAALQILLHRYSRMEDFAIGSPFANRGRAEFDNVVGFFANTLVLRADLSGDPTVEELLARVRTTTLEAHDHADIPFERVVEALQPPRDPSCNPIFQVMFAWQPGHTLADIHLPGLSISRFEVSAGRAKFDLNLQMWHAPEGLAGRWEYDLALFDSATIERLRAMYQRILLRMVEQPAWRVSELVLTDGEGARWPATASWPAERCLHELFEAQAAARPDAVALIAEDGEVTYGELNRRADALAGYLRGVGVSRVGMFVERSPLMIVGILAILKAGAAYVPMDPVYPTERLKSIVDDAGIEVLLTQASLLDRLPATEARVVALDQEWGAVAACDGAVVDPQSACYVIYTSGSTGKPKGVVISHFNVVRLFRATEAWFQFGAGDTWTLFHSYAFDFSVWEIWGALLYGGRLVLVPYMVSRTPRDFYALLCTHGVTVLNQTPSAFQQLSQAEGADGVDPRLALRLVIFGGEALDFNSLGPWFERHGDRHPRLVNMYGITETTVHVTYRPVTADDLKGRSMIGVPIADLSLQIVDEHLRRVPVGVPGELLVGGDGVARGYLNRPELTAQRFIEDPDDPSRRLYRSGDLVRAHADGDIEYLGRLDHQVQLRGFRIELGEIESGLTELAEVLEAAAVIREDVAGDARIVAYVVGTSDVERLREHLRGKLPSYMVPSAIVPLERLPLTSNGKLDRAALPKPSFGGGETLAPRTPLERVLAALFAEVLGVDSIGIQDNFFDAGGHSLLAVRLLARIGERLGRAVPLVRLFQHPTVAGLAASIDEAWTPQVVLRADGEGAPFFCVPGSGGMVSAFRALARRLPGRPFVAIGRPGLDGEAAPHETVEAMAAQAVEAIRRVQEHGPYFLGGHSFGAWVAYEAARRLLDAGEKVGRVVVLDMPAPGAEARGGEIDPERLEATMRHILEAVEGASPGERMLAVLAADERAQSAFSVQEAAGFPIAVLRTSTSWDDFGVSDEALGWQRLSSLPVAVMRVEGTHASMLNSPAVDSLARAVQEVVDS